MEQAKFRLFALTEGTRISPASRIRTYDLLDRLKSSGALDYDAVSFTSDGYCRRLMAGRRPGFLRSIGEQVWHLRAISSFLESARRADVVLIQRVLLPIWLQKRVLRSNPRVIYDFDDAVYLYSGKHAKRFAYQVKTASSVLAVSGLAAEKAIASGAGGDKVNILYTPVDCSRIRPNNSSDPDSFTVGWIGSPSTARYLHAVWPELAEFAAHNPRVKFVFLGCGQFDTGSAAVRFVDWSPGAESEELPRLDVGLMPLEDTPWERGKGGYKLIQYMAAGVATLSSPVGANLEIVEDGRTGLFAAGSGEWKARLSELLADRERCRAMGQAGRERAEKMFDYGVAVRHFTAMIEKLQATL